MTQLHSMGMKKFPSLGVSASPAPSIVWPICMRPRTTRIAEGDSPVTDPSRYPDSKAETARRWVKVGVIIAIVVALFVAVMLLVGGGGHGPGRHF